MAMDAVNLGVSPTTRDGFYTMTHQQGGLGIRSDQGHAYHVVYVAHPETDNLPVV